jgi:hypothetical protein
MFGEKPHGKKRKKEKRADSLPSPSTFGHPPLAMAGGERVIGESFCGGESNGATPEARLANRFRGVVIYKWDFWYIFI